MSFRPWKYLHLGAYISAPFALLHIPNSGSSYASLLNARIYFWAVVVGFAIFGLLRLRGALNLNKSKYIVVNQEQICPGVYTLTVKPTDYDSISPKPGQYIYIKTGWFSEDHPFSVMNFNPTTNTIQIGYKAFGDFTKRLSGIPAGKQLFISGPFGYFTESISNSPTVYIAGGIGVTPFISRIINQNDQREQWLFYSNKEKLTAAYLAPLKQILGNHLIQIYKNHDGDEKGYITEQMIRKYIANPEKYKYYICGSDKLTKSVTAELRKCEVSKNNIEFESFNF
jgi:predicted ferric reductase